MDKKFPRLLTKLLPGTVQRDVFGRDFGTARGALLRRCWRWERGRTSPQDRHSPVAPSVSPEALPRVQAILGAGPLCSAMKATEGGLLGCVPDAKRPQE